MGTLQHLPEQSPYRCFWRNTVETDEGHDITQYFIKSLGVRKHQDLGVDELYEADGFVAVKRNNVWRVEPSTVFLRPSENAVQIRCNELKGEGEVAYPIDPRMTRVDIQGARYHEPNEDGTAWVFHHESIGERRDHELQLMAVIEGIFRPVFHQYGYDHLSGATDTHRNLAIERHGLLASFYGQIILNVQKKARAAYLSERQTSHHFAEGHLYSDLHSVFEETKKKWIAENEAEDFNKVSGAFAFIERRLAIPAPETRWDREARLKAEAESDTP